jgi:hypothetical protein
MDFTLASRLAGCDRKGVFGSIYAIIVRVNGTGGCSIVVIVVRRIRPPVDFSSNDQSLLLT